MTTHKKRRYLEAIILNHKEDEQFLKLLLDSKTDNKSESTTVQQKRPTSASKSHVDKPDSDKPHIGVDQLFMLKSSSVQQIKPQLRFSEKKLKKEGIHPDLPLVRFGY